LDTPTKLSQSGLDAAPPKQDRMMKVAQVTELKGPQAVEVSNIPIPTPGPGEILIEVSHAGVNFPELLQTRGLYQNVPDVPFVVGTEAAGVVVEVSEGSKFSVGDRVVAMPGVGGFAEYVKVAEDRVLKLPDNVSLAHAAAMIINVLTADLALRVRGNLQPGQTVLVHGAAGGLGSAGVQLALAMGAEVVAVVSTDDKAAVVQELGATHVVKVENFKDAVHSIYPDGVDIVFDPVGGDRFTDSIRALKPLGRVQVLGFSSGDIPTVKVNRLLLKNVSVEGVALGEARAVIPGLIQDQWSALTDHLVAGKLNPPIQATYPIEQAGEALAVLDNRAVLGKILIGMHTE